MYKNLLIFSAMAATSCNWLTAQTSKDFRTYGNPNYETVAGVVSDSIGNNVVFGVYQGTLNAGNNIILQSQKGADDFFLIKRDSTGQTIWARSFGANDTIVNQAWYKDIAADLTLDKDGNIYLLGEVNCSADIVFGAITLPNAQTPNAKNVFVSRFDKNGNCDWITVNSTNPNASPKKIVVDGKKRCSITGGAYGGELFGTYTLTSSGNYIAMFDSTGTALWAKSYNATLHALAADQNGYVYCTGSTSASQFGGTAITLKGNADLIAAKIDSTGVLTWVNNEGSPGVTLHGLAIERQGSKLYLLAIHSASLSLGSTALTGSNKFFISGYDLQGGNLWAKPTDVASNWANSAYCDLALNKQGELFVLTNSSSTFLFGTSSINAPGVSAILLKYTAAGSPDWAINYASTVSYGSNTTKIACDHYNHLFIAGNFSGSMAIAGSATLNAFGSGNYDGFASILGTKNITVGFRELSPSAAFSLFPNPNQGLFTISGQAGGYHYTIIDQLGKIQLQGACSQTGVVDTKGLSTGAYLIQLKTAEGVIVGSKQLLITQ